MTVLRILSIIDSTLGNNQRAVIDMIHLAATARHTDLRRIAFNLALIASAAGFRRSETSSVGSILHIALISTYEVLVLPQGLVVLVDQRGVRLLRCCSFPLAGYPFISNLLPMKYGQSQGVKILFIVIPL